MICLRCAAENNEKSEECSGCQHPFQSRPPVVGHNHVSQMLCALDDLREEEIDLETFETVYHAFAGQFESFAEKWELASQGLVERLAHSMKETYATPLAQLEESLGQAYLAFELIDAFLEGEEVALEEAETALVTFFRGSCASAARILEEVDRAKARTNTSRGGLLNLPQV